jgi:hypothetical protein
MYIQYTIYTKYVSMCIYMYKKPTHCLAEYCLAIGDQLLLRSISGQWEHIVTDIWLLRTVCQGYQVIGDCLGRMSGYRGLCVKDTLSVRAQCKDAPIYWYAVRRSLQWLGLLRTDI